MSRNRRKKHQARSRQLSPAEALKRAIMVAVGLFAIVVFVFIAMTKNSNPPPVQPPSGGAALEFRIDDGDGSSLGVRVKDPLKWVTDDDE